MHKEDKYILYLYLHIILILIDVIIIRAQIREINDKIEQLERQNLQVHEYILNKIGG